MSIQGSINLSSLLQKFKRGPKSTPLQVNWVTSTGLKASLVVGVLGTFGFILVSRDRIFHRFYDRDVASPVSWTVSGLENLGNNCFLNVVLQALASCSRFRKYLVEVMGEYGSLLVDGHDNMLLVDSLNSILEELCIVRHRRTTLSPRRVMLAMDHYFPSFNLSREQDAEEAFSHLLSSLRKELSNNYVSNKSYVSDLPALPSRRIISAQRNREESVWERWRRIFLAPFDGILRSILICQSCSFQISLDFELFHSLHLSPPVNSAGVIMPECSILDCVKQFFIAEHLENYCCSRCWHTAAIGYISVVSEDKTDILKLQHCNTNDSCDCKNLSSLKAFPWSNRFSRTFKQLSIARSPKILCIHLQRASYDMFGQPVKLLGHISFPLVLDLAAFMNKEVEFGSIATNQRSRPSSQDSEGIGPFPFSKYNNIQSYLGMVNGKIDTARSPPSETGAAMVHPGSLAGPSSINCRRCPDDNADVSVPSAPVRHQTYRLVSVVEHFGNTGSGHYTVYRRVLGRLDDDDPVALLESAIEQWYCISDTDVHSVSEKDVLNANASMLFYEKINDPKDLK